MKRILVSLLGLAVVSTSVAAQDPVSPRTVAATENIRVFVDNCPCSLDYLRTEIGYVDYVRDRADADVHLLFGYQGTGAGGTSFTLFFIGQRAFAATADTLTFATAPSETEDQERQAIVRYMKMGLMRYVARTPVADRIRISVVAPTTAQVAAQTPARDPWNFWVFRMSAGGGGNGEKARSRISTNGSLSATRTTELWKTRISMNGRYEHSKLTVFIDTAEDGTDLPDEIIKNYTHSAGFSGYVARSLGPHFTAGLTSSASRSTFSNQDLAFRIAPAIEYSFFPYAESTRRLLTANYSLGMNAFDYTEETGYFKTSEQVPDHQLQVSYEVTETWGSAFGSISGQQYLHDIHLYSASAFAFARIRLRKGLDLNFNGSASTIYNQIAVPRAGATEREVLLNRRQLLTPYRISGSVGLSYTFGSILNNIVNPRFNNAGGGEIFFF
jgi:hypothetical protein